MYKECVKNLKKRDERGLELSPRAISATIKMQDTQMSECISFSLLRLLVVSFLLAGLGWLLCLFFLEIPRIKVQSLYRNELPSPTSRLRDFDFDFEVAFSLCGFYSVSSLPAALLTASCASSSLGATKERVH